MAGKTGDRLFKRAANPQWYDRCDPITRKQRSTGETKRADARRVILERELAARELAAEDIRKKNDPNYAATQARVSDWIVTYLDRCKARSLSTATLGMYEGKLGHWLRILGPDATMRDVDRAAFDRFIQTRRDEGAHPHTISKETSIFVRVLTVASRGGVFFQNLDTLVPDDLKPEYEPRERALPMAEVSALLEETSGPLNALIAISAALGLRRSEAVKLRPQDVDLVANVVHVAGTKTKEARRRIPILSLFRDLLVAAIPAMPIGKVPNNIYRGLTIACRRAGITYCTPNDLRRSHATILLEHDVSPDVVRRILGHTSEAMLRRVYGRTRPEILSKQAESAIQRSTNAATVSVGQPCTESDEFVSVRICNERLEVSVEQKVDLGFLSRRSHVQIVSGALVSAPSHRGTQHKRSSSETGAARLALGYAALNLGLFVQAVAS